MSKEEASGRSAHKSIKSSIVQARGRFLTVIVLRLDGLLTDQDLQDQLSLQLDKTPNFFAGAPAVLDLGDAVDTFDNDRILTVLEFLKRRSLQVFGVQHALGLNSEKLKELGLIVVSTGRDAPAPRPAEPVPIAEAPKQTQSKIVKGHVRSGQMIVAEHGDLTVIGSVSSGAELIAAGNIHVYGTLRGRAIAGCHGDETAHIFCQVMDAELVAIAGLYQTHESVDDTVRQRCTNIYLENDSLRLEVIA